MKNTTQTNKEVFYISGLPRSGSTLLTSLLAQNESFYCSPTSGVRDMIELVKNNWNANEHFQASFEIESIDNMLYSMMQGYYSNKKEEVIFDKNRGWLGSMKLAEALAKGNLKVIVTVRDIVDVLSSFEKLYRKNGHNFMLPQAKQNPAQFNTLAGRCENWVSSEGLVGSCYVRILEALKTGYESNILFVDYSNLTVDPEGELKRIYEFLGKEWKDNVHYYKDVKSNTHEYEIARGFPQSLHDVGIDVKPQKSDAPIILGDELFEKYSNSEFWKKYI